MVTLAKHAGFCFGVKHAITEVEASLRQNCSYRLYTLGELIHNKDVINELSSKGIQSIEELDLPSIFHSANLHNEVFIFTRTHGIKKEVALKLGQYKTQNPYFHVQDLTCPFVSKIHQIVDQNTTKDTILLLLGKKEHPESIGILSYAHGPAFLFENADEFIDFIKNEPQNRAYIACAQTTSSLSEWEKIKKNINSLCTNIKFFDTICNVTSSRQNEAIQLAKKSNTMVVIGGAHSSNSNQLYQICSQYCKNSYFIENASEFGKIQAISPISVTAGASTPQNIILEVFLKMSESNFESLLNDNLKSIHTGEIVTGIVSAVTDKCVYLDLGTKQTGVIDAEKLVNADDLAGKKITDLFHVWDVIKAKVIRVNDKDGVIDLDKLRVDHDQEWYSFVDSVKSEPICEGKVVSALKSGVLMEVGGKQIFIPASQTGIAKDGDLSTLVGTTQKIKILEVDEERKRTVGSIKAYKRLEQKLQRQAAEAAKIEVFNSLQVGQKFTTTIKNLTQYGAFVDLGGIDGMIHVSELSWKAIRNPAQVVSVGDEVTVYIKELDPETHRISLGYKTPEMDQFAIYCANHSVGEIVSAKIVSFKPYGAFAEIAEDVDGLIHISRISLDQVKKPEDVLSIGQIVDVKIVGINKEKREISLSIKAILEAQKREEDEARRKAEREERDAEYRAQREEAQRERDEMAPYIIGSID